MKLYLNCTDNNITFNKKNYLLRAAKRLGMDDVVNYNGEEKPECVLNIEPFTEFVKGTTWTGVWEIDCLLDRVQMKLDDWIASDMVFLANSFYPARMNAYQGEKQFMFQAADPVLHRRIASIDQDFDFVFAGSAESGIYDKRIDAIVKLRAEKFTFKDYGKNHIPEEYVNFINSAKVQFIRSASNGSIGDSQIEQRFFECLAIGPVLKDYHPQLEHIGLEEGKDFYWYKTESEMIEKMHYLIDNPDFAATMAANGRKKVLMYHTYEHRLITLKQIINEHIQAK